MGMRLPNAGTVAAFALLAGASVGAGTAALDAATRPWRIGDFAPEAIHVRPDSLPKVDVPETVHHFGTVGMGGTGTHAFVIGNTGTAPLTLSRGATSCTCTVSDFEAGGDGSPTGTKVIAPGTATKVKVQWRGKAEGPFRQQATILTNDPRRPEIALVVEGLVIPTWKAVPNAIVLPRLSSDGGERATARIFTFGKEPPVIESISAPDPQISPFLHLSSSPLEAAEIAAETGATGGFLLTVEVKPGLPPGPLRQTVRMVFRMPEEVTAELPLEGTVTGDLALAGTAWDSSHQAVSLGTVSSRSGLRTDLFLTAKGPHRTNLRPVVREVIPKSLVVEVGEGKPIGSGAVLRFPLTITIPPGSPTCNHLCSQQARGGRIVIETGHPDTPTLTIPVCVAISP
jgi:hypothetical protein